jgi:hypothetical protein
VKNGVKKAPAYNGTCRVYAQTREQTLGGTFLCYEKSILGCGLGWAVELKVWADYEQLLREVFSTFCGKKKKKKKF